MKFNFQILKIILLNALNFAWFFAIPFATLRLHWVEHFIKLLLNFKSKKTPLGHRFLIQKVGSAWSITTVNIAFRRVKNYEKANIFSIFIRRTLSSKLGFEAFRATVRIDIAHRTKRLSLFFNDILTIF